MSALAPLETLRQTGSVAAYKATHVVLAAETNLLMQLRIHWWERGLNPNIAAQVKVNPLTYKEYTDICHLITVLYRKTANVTILTKHNLLPVLCMHMRLLLLLQLT